MRPTGGPAAAISVGCAFRRGETVPGLDQPPPGPYVRARDAACEWHIAVRVLIDDSIVIRCRFASLSPPLEWRSTAPETSVDAVMCRLCSIV